MVNLFGRVALLLKFVLMITACMGQECNFDDACTWTIRNGFRKSNYTTWASRNKGSERNESGLNETAGKFVVVTITLITN